MPGVCRRDSKSRSLVTGNETVHFESLESKDFSQLLLPDSNENPVYQAVVTAPRDRAFGYTTYTDPKTGYSYTDDYTAPAHTAGEWQTITPATYDSEGLRRQTCAECGALLAEEAIPRLIAATSCVLNESRIRLAYRQTAQLQAAILPENATDQTVIWTSSNESVARVDDNGLVTATGAGTAVIACKTGDGFAGASCEVEVSFSAGQWITRYVLFGWLWQK